MQRRLAGFALAFVGALAVAAGAGEAPRRIVSTSPNTTEILYGVGAFARVVGVSRYCSFPPGVKTLPRIGGWQDSDISKIAKLHPDLVLLTDAQAPFLEDKLRAAALPALVVPSRTLSDVFVAIDRVGKATHQDAQAAALALSIRTALDGIRQKVKTLPRRSVLLCVSRTPGTLRDMYVATQGSYLIDLVEVAGGRTITEPAPTGYAKISSEAVLALNPEVIIDLARAETGAAGERPLEVWNDFPELRAVRDHQVKFVNRSFVPHASQFVSETAMLFAQAIHPEAFRSGAR